MAERAPGSTWVETLLPGNFEVSNCMMMVKTLMLSMIMLPTAQCWIHLWQVLPNGRTRLWQHLGGCAAARQFWAAAHGRWLSQKALF